MDKERGISKFTQQEQVRILSELARERNMTDLNVVVQGTEVGKDLLRSFWEITSIYAKHGVIPKITEMDKTGRSVQEEKVSNKPII